MIKSVKSYNCLRLDNSYIFQVEVYQEDSSLFFEFGNKILPFEELMVGQLAELISHKGRFEDSDILILWKVDVDESKLSPNFTEDSIKNLGGELMKRQCKFIKYFQDGYEPTRENIISIVAFIATTSGKCLPMFYCLKKLILLFTSPLIFFLNKLDVINILPQFHLKKLLRLLKRVH
jgi:hypothetical protein